MSDIKPIRADVIVDFYDAEGKPLPAVGITWDSLSVSRPPVPPGAASFSVRVELRSWAQNTSSTTAAIVRGSSPVIEVRDPC